MPDYSSNQLPGAAPVPGPVPTLIGWCRRRRADFGGRSLILFDIYKCIWCLARPLLDPLATPSYIFARVLLLSPPSTTFLSNFFLAISSPDCRIRSVSDLRSTVSWLYDNDALPRVPFVLSNLNSFQGSPPTTFSPLHIHFLSLHTQPSSTIRPIN